MLEALIAGERDGEVLADMARGRMRPKIPDLVQAMIGRFGEHHAFLCRMHLDRIDALTRDITTLSTRIGALMAPFHDVLNRLDTIPGVNQTAAEVIIAETGADMSRSPPPDIWRPGPGSVPATTSPADAANPAGPAKVTTGSPPPSASPSSPPAVARTPTSPPNTPGSSAGWATSRKPSSPSNTAC